MNTDDPQTFDELEAALEAIGCEMIDIGPERWAVRVKDTGIQLRLDCSDLLSAMHEAYHAMKP